MDTKFPQSTAELIDWSWEQIEPLYRELEVRQVSGSNINDWLLDWSRVSEHVSELGSRLYVATTVNTQDKQADERFSRYMDTIFPGAEAAEQRLKEKFLDSGLEPEGFAVALRNLRAEAALFHEANLPLLSDEQKIGMEYDKIVGAQTVEWEGEERTLSQMRPLLFETDRSVRERAWRRTVERARADREAIGGIWTRLLGLRQGIAANADMPDYRAYQWQRMHRFDYTPADSKSFLDAIEKTVVPAANRIYERRRRQLGVETLRPWDLDVDPLGRPPLRPFETADQLIEGAGRIFDQVDPALGAHFQVMREEGLLDLANRKNKAPGGYCNTYNVARRPFIFMNAVGLHGDMATLLHEGGHSFHVFESVGIRYHQLMTVPMEFAEVASMSMELLSGPYLTASGLYSPADAARALTEMFQSNLLFWPYMAVVDAYQHWVYEHPDKAADIIACDSAWGEQWQRFMPAIDFTGLEAFRDSRWMRQLHIIQIPFYYVEYGLAQLGATQIWGNARQDQAAAVRAYRAALALGGTVPLPDLFAAAGARFAFDAGTLQRAVDLYEQALQELEASH